MREGIIAARRHLRPFKKHLWILTVLGVLSAAGNGFVPYITGRFLDSLIEVSQSGFVTGSGLPLWLTLLVAWALVQVVANNVDWIIERMRRAFDTRLHVNMQLDGFLHLFRLPMSFHKEQHISASIERLSKAGWRISSIASSVINIAPQLLSVFIGLVLAVTISPLLASILIAGVAVYLMLLIYILRPMATIEEESHRKWNEGWDRVAQRVYQIDSLKNASAEAYEEKQARSIFETIFALWMRLEYHWSNVSFFQRMIIVATQLTVFVLSIQLIAQQTITIGELVALNSYAAMFFGPFVRMGTEWQSIQNGLVAIASAEEIFQIPEEIYVPPHAKRPDPFVGSVQFDQVNFTYAQGNPILSDISISVESGEVVAFVGASGVGKSTAISLISAYFFPTEGEVKVSGVNTREFDLTYLRKHIAVVPQEVALFNDTIRMNIAYGTFDATQEQIEHAAKEAHLEEFIEELPQKYDTVVGERGIKLSVGQKQRIAIARAILRDPKILILDEPTSALDAKTEHIITQSLERLMEGRTTFIIAHRLSTVRRADKILVFDKGKIVEEGKHDELIKIEGGVYRNLYEHQIGLHA